jgi:uncharacterized protein (DUF2141 family)
MVSGKSIGRSAYFALAGLAASALAPIASAQEATTKVTVTLNKVMSDAGTIRAALCDDPAAFGQTNCAVYSATAPAKTGTMELTFTGVKPGTYALAIYHDEDSDGRLNVFSEPFAFGNGATALPPTFEGAKLNITGDLKTETALFRMVQ